MGALLVERTGAGVIVRAEESGEPIPPPPFTLADGRTQVYIDESALPAFDQLEPEVLAALRAELRPDGVGLPAIRLLSPRAGLAAPNGSRPLALRLSEALDVEVVAPDGELVMLPGGELFSAGPQTGWVGFRPGRSKLHDGPSFPVPEWQDGLSTSLRTRPIDPRISVTPIPAGVWVRTAGQPARPHSDIGFRVPLSRNRLAIVVGAPGEPLPAAEALAAFVGGLPAQLRETFGLIGYGPEPVSVRPIAQQLAELIGQAVHGCHAVPQYLPAGGQTWLVPDDSGRPSWLPFVLESTYQPGVPPIPRNWLPPVSGLTEAGTGTFWLQDGWLVDVLPAGLLVRPVRVPVDPVASRLPISPDAVNFVISSAGGPPPQRVLTAVERLAGELPAAARERLRLIATPHADPTYLGRLAASLKVDVHVLGAAGPGPAVESFASAPLGAHPWEASTGVVPAGIGGQTVAWIPAPPSGASSVDQPTAQLPTVAQRSPAAPAGNEPATGSAGAAPQPIPHQPTEPLRIVSPVVVDAEGRMRPIGDGWRPGQADAAPLVAPAADVVSVPPVPAALGPATPLPQLSPPQSAQAQAPEPSAPDAQPSTDHEARGPITPALAAIAEADTPAGPEKPVEERRPVVASPVAVPVTATSVQIPAVASSTPLPSMKPAEPEPEPEPEPAAPVRTEAVPEAPAPVASPPVASAGGPPAAAPRVSAAPAPPSATPAPRPAPSPMAPAAQPTPPPAAAAPGPAPVAPAAAINRMSAPAAAPAVSAPVGPPGHAPAPTLDPAAVAQRPAPEQTVAAVPVSTTAVPAEPAVQQAVSGAVNSAAAEDSKNEVAQDTAESQSAAERTTTLNLADIRATAVHEGSAEADSAHQGETAATEQVSFAEAAETSADASEAVAEAETRDQAAAAVLKPLLLVDHASTEEDRQQFKKSLGWKYDAATRSVTRLLAERPGLRGGMPVDDAMLTELAAVHVFATSDQREFVNAIRTGDVASHYPFISCLAGGLRRLPSLQGLVVRGGPGDAETVEDYVVGSELVEPAPMLGVSDESASVPGSVELLIWSVTARRLGGLAADENSADVVFPPATSYRVLAVEADAGRVLLTEVGKKQRSEEACKRHDARVLERLTEAAKNRDERPAADATEPDRERYSVLLGEPTSPFAKAAGVDR
ncbi:hypothetical protein E1202_25870 [Saccharopolyspora karakumensis]|uniref:Uncharacterized protein n=1 Tax=Saccharopolyspora karakumensis TaxID=2530386 RepID=A0A4R5BAR2_9PSEU|nr:hypothetical protein [Saccharopolyspora karakumensis]TDD83161.1 hypothetical protein E1202_25870 [Saccharopolyspora karakumensis]